MDILAGMLAYVAGVGTLFAGLVVSFFVFSSTPHESLQTQAQRQTTNAMLVRPSPPNKPTHIEAHTKQSANHSEKHAHAAGSPSAAQPAASAGNIHRSTGISSAQARRLIQEERPHRWAYQQESSFEGRFLGYAD